MDSLSDDILMQILSRVCILDTARARCVCKRWKTIMEDPIWHTSNPNNKVLILQSREKLFFVDLTDESTASQAKPRVCFIRILPYFKIIGSCNSLLCLFYKGIFYITNPFAKEEMRPLPELPPQNGIKECGHGILTCGFGYDSTSKLYKVMALVFQSGCNRGLSQVMVSDSGSMMNWRIVGKTFHYPWNSPIPEAFTNGRLHWTSWNDKTIVSFDLADEKLRYINLPDFLILCKDCDLIVFQDCLCLVKKSIRRYGLKLQFWTMKKYGVGDSWVKEFDTEDLGLKLMLPVQCCLDVKFIKVMGEVNNGKILIVYHFINLRGMLLYEPLNNHNYKFVEFEDLPFCWNHRPSIHTPSLNQMSHMP